MLSLVMKPGDVTTDEARPLGTSGGVIDTTARLLRAVPSCHKCSIGDDEVFRSTEPVVEYWLVRRESPGESVDRDARGSFAGARGGSGSAVCGSAGVSAREGS